VKVVRLGSKAIQFNDPSWNGAGFDEAEAHALWQEFPENLQSVVQRETSAGNQVTFALKNLESGIVVIGLARGPLVKLGEAEAIRVHTQHAYGNYCYDGTLATFEDLSSGCILAFENPDYEASAV
jgi:hypothetical protein